MTPGNVLTVTARLIGPQADNSDKLRKFILRLSHVSFCFWLLELPLAYVLSVPLGVGPTGAYLAIAIAYSALALAGAILFRRGRWNLKTV